MRSISLGAIDKNETVFVTFNQCTISKCNIYVDNVKVTGQCLIDCFACWSFGDSRVQAKRDWGFTSVNKVSVFRSINDMAVVVVTMTSRDSMKFFWHPPQFCAGSFWTIAGANWWKSGAWMM